MRLRKLVASYKANFDSMYGKPSRGCFNSKKQDVAERLVGITSDVVESFNRDDYDMTKDDIARLIARLERLYVTL